MVRSERKGQSFHKPAEPPTPRRKKKTKRRWRFSGRPAMRPATVALVLLGLALPLAGAIEGFCGAGNGGQCFSCTREDGSCTTDDDCFGSSRQVRNGGCRCENPWRGPRDYQPRNNECRYNSRIDCSEVDDMEYCNFVDHCSWNSEEGKCEEGLWGLIVLIILVLLGGVLGLWFCRTQGYRCSKERCCYHIPQHPTVMQPQIIMIQQPQQPVVMAQPVMAQPVQATAVLAQPEQQPVAATATAMPTATSMPTATAMPAAQPAAAAPAVQGQLMQAP
jgi:hypothetical protein